MGKTISGSEQNSFWSNRAKQILSAVKEKQKLACGCLMVSFSSADPLRLKCRVCTKKAIAEKKAMKAAKKTQKKKRKH